MKLKFFLILTLLVIARMAWTQGTTFTYQGRLADNGAAAGGAYDLTFSVFNAATSGGQVGSTLTNSAVGVTNGLFTVALDFGAGVFDGSARWLQIAVRTNGGGAFTALNPRQPLTAAPYAITASNLSGTLPATKLTGTLPAGALSGTYTGVLAFSNPGNSFSGTTVSAQTITVTNTASTGTLIVRTNIQFGTNAGYVMTFPSVSGLLGPTNLGFNFSRSATWWDLDKPPDEVMMWGYNLSMGGGLADNHDSALGFSIEGNYNTGGAEYTEAHLHYVDKSGTQRRPWSWRISKSETELDWQHLIQATKISVFDATNLNAEYVSISPEQFIYKLGPGFTNGIKIYPVGPGVPGVQFLPSGGAANPQLWLTAWSQVVTPVGTMTPSAFYINQQAYLLNKPLTVQSGAAVDVGRLDVNGLTMTSGQRLNFLYGTSLGTPLSGQILSTNLGTITVAANLAVGDGLTVAGNSYVKGATAYSLSVLQPAAATNFVADFLNNYQTITATNEVNFLHATNLPLGGTNVLTSTIKIVASGASRSFRAPTTWRWMSTNGLSFDGLAYIGTIPDGKAGWLSLYADGGAQDNVSASWVQQP